MTEPGIIVLVPKVGVEPTRVLPHTSLSRARLPIPPLRHIFFSTRLAFASANHQYTDRLTNRQMEWNIDCEIACLPDLISFPFDILIIPL